jgi:hypothetical protein
VTGAREGYEDGAAYRGRFPGFDVVSLAGTWDPATADAVLGRLSPPSELRFFSPAEQAAATALLDQLLGLPDDEPRVPVLQLIDARLADLRTDGWRYADMPEDDAAWRDSLAGLDNSAQDRFGFDFASGPAKDQAALIQAVHDHGAGAWHGMVASHVWSLWTRYACTAFYSHPLAWNEIGFPGPAYPRGYKNPGVDALEPFEKRDTHGWDDPVRKDP